MADRPFTEEQLLLAETLIKSDLRFYLEREREYRLQNNKQVSITLLSSSIQVDIKLLHDPILRKLIDVLQPTHYLDREKGEFPICELLE